MTTYFVYKLTNPITVAVQQGGQYRLAQLPAGCLFRTPDSKPDCNGMISGTCLGDQVLVFSRDLEDCAIPIGSEAASCMSASG